MRDLSRHLRLQCHHCTYRPRPNVSLKAVAWHNTTEHPGITKLDQLQMDLVVVCPSCDISMDIIRTERVSRRQDKHVYRCPQCGLAGYVLQKKEREAP